MDAQQLQGGLIIVLSLSLGFCLWRLFKQPSQRPLYIAECEAMDAALKAEFAKALAMHELRVSGLIAELGVKQAKVQKLRDERDSARDRAIKDIQLVLENRLRFKP